MDSVLQVTQNYFFAYESYTLDLSLCLTLISFLCYIF